MRTPPVTGGMACAGLIALAAPSAPGGPFPITRVVNAETLVPGTSTPFGSALFIDGAPTSDGVAFTALDGTWGVYEWTPSGLRLVAAAGVPVPGGPTIASGLLCGASGNQILSYGGNGVYRDTGGTTVAIAAEGIPLPNGQAYSAPYWSDITAGTSAMTIPFQGTTGGIFAHHDSTGLRTVLDQTTPHPGGGVFTGVGGVGVSANARVFFTANDPAGVRGLYAEDNGFQRWVRTGDAAPGGGEFTLMSNSVRPDGNTVMFQSQTTAGRGWYLADGSGVSPVVATGDLLPGGASIAGLLTADIDDGAVVFRATDSNGLDGLYLADGGIITPVLVEGDSLDGRVVETVWTTIFGDAFDGTRFAFAAWFTDGTKGVYYATIPAAPTVIPLGVAAGLVARRRRPRA